MSNSKEILRAEIKEKLKALSFNDFSDFSNTLSENLQSLIATLGLKESDLFGVFYPIAGEPLWFSRLEDRVLSQLAFPAGEKEFKMDFYRSDLDSLVETNEFGVKVKTPIKNSLVKPDVFFVPGLAFTRSGERLGRGKGYYDRYLETLTNIKIGICYDFQITDDVFSDRHDVKMDYIVTEKEIIKCSS